MEDGTPRHPPYSQLMLTHNRNCHAILLARPDTFLAEDIRTLWIIILEVVDSTGTSLYFLAAKRRRDLLAARDFSTIDNPW